jgi:hypothetical protein
MRYIFVFAIALSACKYSNKKPSAELAIMTIDTNAVDLSKPPKKVVGSVADCNTGYFAKGTFAIGSSLTQVDCATRFTTYTLKLTGGKPQWSSRYGSNFYETPTQQCFVCEFGVGGRFSPGGVVGQYDRTGAFILYICKVISEMGQPTAKWVSMGACN